MKMRTQRSCGAICYRRTRRGVQYLLLSTVYARPGKMRWEFPKGKVEPGESDVEAARREVFEETGVQVEAFAKGFTRENRYKFRVGEELIDKTVLYYLAPVAPGTPTRISEESKALRWARYQTARSMLAIRSLQGLLDEAHAFITGVPKRALVKDPGPSTQPERPDSRAVGPKTPSPAAGG